MIQEIHISDLISFVGIIVAFVTLFFQARSVRRQMELQNFIEYTKRYQEIILQFPENINEHSFSFEHMPIETRNSRLRLMRAYYDLCFEEYTLHRKKYVSKVFWSIWEDGMSFAFSKTAFQDAWRIIIQDTKFGADFERFVEAKVMRLST
jgi:hypothetical protein